MYLEQYIIDPSKYEEERIIGEGNFSTVWLVHPKANKKVNIAQKKITIDTKDNDVQKSLIREILVMSELDHPCLINFLGFSFPSKNDQTFKIYSEYLPNKTLLEQLKEYTLTPTQKTIIIYGIASAMSYLHQKNIVHRDLKPENIFLNSEYEPVLSDFGLSKICNNELTMTGRLGTPYFMAPELFHEENDETLITNKIDVYAFAVTLLSMFTTSYRFQGRQPRTIGQLVSTVLSGKRYQIPSNVPTFYINLINQCWSDNEAKRPSFDEIIELFESNDEFILEGSDKKKVKEFIKKVQNSSQMKQMNKSNNNQSFSSSSDEEVEKTQEFYF